MFAAMAAWSRSRSSPPIRSIVVLPFQDDSSDHQSGYLANGLTDEITNDLTNFNGLRVIGRTTAVEFSKKGIDIRDIGRQFNVDASLEGSLDREGDRLRIRAQLSRNSDGYQLWSRGYDVQFRDLIEVQKNIARLIADDLQLSSSVGAAARPARHDPNPEAHELYLRGTEAWNAATADSFRKGAEFFQAAVEQDPRFAQAWLSLANAHWNIGVYGGWKGISAAQVESEAQHALDLDPGLASAHATLGQIVWRHELDWTRAEAEFRTALKYGAGSYNVHNLYAGCLAERGEFEECHRQFRIAQELSPLQDALFTNEAAIYIAEGKSAEAERELRRVLTRKPGFGVALADLAIIRFLAKDCGGGADYVTQMAKSSPGVRIASILNWSLLICRGKSAEARQMIDSSAPLLSRIDLAAAHASLGDGNQALDLLEESLKQGDIGITAIHIRTEFIPLRSNPRFMALEKRIGLAR
jgi:TolB-like protein/Tfp pilus assembly protein PilF